LKEWTFCFLILHIVFCSIFHVFCPLFLWFLSFGWFFLIS
jgi:hypothetical protein